MTAATTNLINALTLIFMSIWGYFGSETPSPTAFIPAVFGVILLVLNTGVRRENKLVAHIAVTLTLIILISLFAPLTGALGRNDTEAVIRIMVMIMTSIVAMVMFVRSFIRARKVQNIKK